MSSPQPESHLRRGRLPLGPLRQFRRARGHHMRSKGLLPIYLGHSVLVFCKFLRLEHYAVMLLVSVCTAHDKNGREEEVTVSFMSLRARGSEG